MKIYTKTGDEGYTKNAKGENLLKTDNCIELIGTIDEINSFLGITKHLSDANDIKADIETIQKNLMYIMGKYQKRKKLSKRNF